MPLDLGSGRLDVARIYIQCFAIGEYLAIQLNILNALVTACLLSMRSTDSEIGQLGRALKNRPTSSMLPSNKSFPT